MPSERCAVLSPPETGLQFHSGTNLIEISTEAKCFVNGPNETSRVGSEKLIQTLGKEAGRWFGARRGRHYMASDPRVLVRRIWPALGFLVGSE
jgi:hypothetical protein